MRTKIVKETLNIRFLENTPNVKGNGPDWLFDVDSLTISMNYVPVAARSKTNGIVGTKDNIIAGQAQMEKEPEQEYILIPLCITDLLISQGPEDCEGDAGMKPTEVDENETSNKSGKHDQEARNESERLNQREMQTEHTNSSNGINNVSTPVSTAGPSFDIVVPSTPVSTARPSFDTAVPSTPVILLDLLNAYDDEDVEEEVDINNVISSYTVPDTSFTKFNKDPPEDQVIGSRSLIFPSFCHSKPALMDALKSVGLSPSLVIAKSYFLRTSFYCLKKGRDSLHSWNMGHAKGCEFVRLGLYLLNGFGRLRLVKA
ncbi:hypothetical protein Tco_0059061 [Tanacetum coccineum]